jgi:ketosteroid isomerase-like protein
MKRIIPYLIVTVTLLSFASAQVQQQPTDSKSEQQVRQMIEKYRAALLRHDIRALEKIWADDYVFVNASGEVMTKPQRLENLKSGATSFESIKEEENLTVRTYQNSAVATSRVTIKGQYGGNRRPGNTGVPMFG